MRKLIVIILVCVWGLSFAGAQEYKNMLAAGRSARQLFFSDSLNAYCLYRIYPEPSVSQTPPPEGYEPVYVSMYARHGSRKLHRPEYSAIPRAVLASADSMSILTPLGKEVLRKVSAIDDDARTTMGDLTAVGESQHRGIAKRMYLNYPSLFGSEDAVVNSYSTAVQRTMLSMFANNEQLLRLNPKLNIVRQASASLTWLNKGFPDPYKGDPHRPCENFISRYLDCRPIMDRLFTDPSKLAIDTVEFIRCLYFTASIVRGLDIEDVDYMRNVFSPEELYVLQQAMSYMMYVRNANSPENGENTLPSQVFLLKDIVDRADEAMASGKVAADLRFGHDVYLIPLISLMGVNGYGACEQEPLKVAEVFQDYAVAPMAGNIQLVFYRNSDNGEVILKVLQNEVESTLPIPTESFPYYKWEDVKAYFKGLIHAKS